MPDPLDPPAPGTDTDPLAAASAPGSSVVQYREFATVLRKTTVKSRGGGARETRTPAGTLPCNLTKVKKWVELAQAGQIRAVTTWEAQFPVGSDLRPPDQVVVDGVTFEVTDTDSDLSGALVLTAQLLRIEQPRP